MDTNCTVHVVLHECVHYTKNFSKARLGREEEWLAPLSPPPHDSLSLSLSLTDREGILPDSTAATGYNVGRIELVYHGCCLAGLNCEHQLIIPAEREREREREREGGGIRMWGGMGALYLLFCHICSKASASSALDISSAS